MSELVGYMRLNEAFQYVSDELLDIVEQEKRKKKKRPMWRVAATVAACICVLLLPVGVIAARWFGLWDLILPKEDNEGSYLTMYDYASSSELSALREWKQFLAGYDMDRTILSEAMEKGFVPEGREDWLLYGVYSYEMGEKLDQIAKKYGLMLHTTMDTLTFKELQGWIGASFITDANIEDCLVYENGSFTFKGDTELNGCGEVAFEFNCTVKGALDGTIPSWGGDPNGWDEWSYDAACGEYTRLSLGASFGMIVTGSSDRYLMVYVPVGHEFGITKENLQELADKIDFRLIKDMQLPEVSKVKPVSNKTLISLSGYMDSPEAQALAEWEDFLAHYDTDHKIADGIGNGAFIAEGREDWSQYSIYSYEMGEKLDEIVAKYGLKLHTEINVANRDDFIDRVGGCFMENLEGGYIYEDGYFHVEGDVDLTGCGTTGFQLSRSVKGTFNAVYLNIGQPEEYTEWQYITVCGEQVLLAMGSYKGLIFGDFEKCFVAVNVLLGSEEGMTKEDLQEFADKIDFTILKDVKVPEMRGDTAGMPTEGPLLREIFHGEVGNLGSGTLITADFCDDKQDYRFYFVADKNGEEEDSRFNVKELKPEDADYIFPDAREGNIPIGTFQGFVVFELGDIWRDGTSDILLIGLYGVGEDFCVDSRVYTESGEGYVLNTALTQELNEKYYYYNAMEFPFRKILNDFGL